MKRNKKGLSVIIGYVLLISFGIIMAGIVYTYLKSYVQNPEVEDCPDGTSIMITNADCSSGILTLNIKNNGRFIVNGYRILGGSESSELISTPMAAYYISSDPAGQAFEQTNTVAFKINFEDFGPGNKSEVNFSLPYPNLGKVELQPIRKSKNEQKQIVCTNVKVRETFTCS